MKTEDTLVETNNLIAKFMGGRIIDDEQEYNSNLGYKVLVCHWKLPEGVPLHDIAGAKSGYFKYDLSWDWLMPVIRKINSLNKGTQFAIFKTYASCTVEKGGKFYKDFSFSHAEYITNEQSDIKACWKLVMRFVNWYDEYKPQE